jgi:hypothetical protein
MESHEVPAVDVEAGVEGGFSAEFHKLGEAQVHRVVIAVYVPNRHVQLGDR